jgi:hypothetical protein
MHRVGYISGNDQFCYICFVRLRDKVSKIDPRQRLCWEISSIEGRKASTETDTEKSRLRKHGLMYNEWVGTTDNDRIAQMDCAWLGSIDWLANKKLSKRACSKLWGYILFQRYQKRLGAPKGDRCFNERVSSANNNNRINISRFRQAAISLWFTPFFMIASSLIFYRPY